MQSYELLNESWINKLQEIFIHAIALLHLVLFQGVKKIKDVPPYVVTTHENETIMRTTNPHIYNLSLIKVPYLTTIPVAKVI